MAFKEQLEYAAESHQKYVIPSTAFSDPNNPKDSEVFLWANNPLNIEPEQRGTSLIVYQPLDSYEISYAYVWRCLVNGGNLKLVKLRDRKSMESLVINTSLITNEPTPTGNLNNLNEVVTVNSTKEVWIIDMYGNAINLNKTYGDFTVLDSSKGYVHTATDNSKWRVKILKDGSLITEKL